MRLRPVPAGELDQVITLLTRAPVVDSRGQVVSEWRDVAETAARARPVSSREVFRSGEMQALGVVVFAIRYRIGVTAAMAVRWRGNVYELMAEPVNVDGGNHTLELIAGSRPA